tara:strand:- start:453 stop:1802 length:1350 start_codon:yes stop_codon:yes gene_type:complete
MINKRNLIFLLILILLNNCSFDDKTGIWSGGEEEKRRISDLEKEQKKILNISKIYSSDAEYTKEISLKKTINLSRPKNFSSWKMSGLNHQNFLGNIYLSGIDNTFIKKKIGKNKYSLSKNKTSPLVIKDNIILSDNNGTIYNLNFSGKLNWKKNIYKKIHKKIYKNLTFSVYKNIIYVADNLGFIYAISLQNGKLIWIKNHGLPLKSKIKVFDNKIFLINQDNRFFSLNTKDGTKIWDIRAIASFIKIQNFLSIAVTKKGQVIGINSSGDLFKVNAKSGEIYWSLNTTQSLFAHASDFFYSSEIVITDDEILFSSGQSFYSYNIEDGYINWEQEVNSVGAPIVDGKNIFIVTNNGYFVIIDRKTGKIISSNNILKILKKKKQNTQISGFIMGSGKIYSVTLNGFLIVSSAETGKVENFKKIGDPMTSAPIINNGKLYILTNNSKIIGLN